MKKFLAVLLAVMMVVSMLPTHAFAAEENKYFSDEAIAAGEEKIEEVLAAVELVMELVPEYYDEAYAYGYNYALENGYIAIAQEGLDIAIDAIEAIDLDITHITDESKTNIYTELEAVVDTLEELKAVLANNEAANVNGLVETVFALEDDLYTHLNNLETFTLQAGADIYELVYLPQKAIIEEQVIPAVRAAAEAMLREVYAHVVAKVAEIYGIVVEVNATVEEIIETVRDHIDHITAGELVITPDFFYLAITDGNDGYADLVAAALGLTEEQYKKVTMEEVTAADMAQANFITVGYSGVSALDFAVQQMLGVANDYVEYVDGFVQAVDTKMETNFPKVMEMVGIDIYDTVMEVVETEAGAYLALVEGKEVTEMDWIALVGEENVAYVEAVLEELRAILVSEGITETISYSVNVVEVANQMIAENTDNLVKLNEEELYAALGEHAVFEIEVSVVDLAVFAAESALYEFTSYNVEYANTMMAITAVNPEATVAVLGNYNRFDVNYEFVTEEIRFTLADVLAQFGFEGFELSAEAEEAIATLAAMNVVNIPAGELVDYVMGYYNPAIDMAVRFELPVCEQAETMIDELIEKADAQVQYVVGRIQDVYVVDLHVVDLLNIIAEFGYDIDALINASLNTEVVIASEVIQVNDVLDLMAQITSVHPFAYAVANYNVYFVNICDAREGGNEYIAEQILNGLTVSYACEHEYDDCEDAFCNLCGEWREAPGHSFTKYVSNEDAVCGVDGTKTAVCDNGCGAEDTITDEGTALAHVEKIVPGYAATCTTTGLTDGKECAVCGVTLAEQQILPITGHTPVTIPGVAATCTSAGRTTGQRCYVCGIVLIPQETIPALAHTEEIIPAVEATCTTTGLTEGKKCSVCGEILVAQEEVAMLAHTYESVVTEPTCDRTGYTTHTCTVCGHSYKDSTTAKRAHKWDDGVIVKEPTCTRPGSKQVSCSYDDCDAFYFDNLVPATGHTEETIPAVAAGCETTGLTEGKKCSVCGEILVAQEEIAATGHSFGEWTVSKEATRKEAGEETRTCSGCGKTETREIPVIESGANVGAIVGGSVGGVGAVSVAVYFFLKKKKLF